jgi:hypothetical protein
LAGTAVEIYQYNSFAKFYGVLRRNGYLAGDNFFSGSVGLIDVQFAVSEPSTFAIMVLGFGALFLLVHRRRNHVKI